MANLVVSFVISVAAGVVSYYICRLLDTLFLRASRQPKNQG